MRQCMDSDNLHRRIKNNRTTKCIDKIVDKGMPCEDILIQINTDKNPYIKFEN